MNIWELSEKAEYIADKNQRLQAQWHQYGNTLIRGITLSKAKLHHSVGCTQDESLSFSLFEYFTVHISMARGFNNHAIEFVLSQPESGDKVLIAKATIDEEGLIDNSISNRDCDKILDHYLEKIRPVYECLYRAVHENTPLSMALLQQPDMA